jgi:hypothetical protein
VVSSALSSGPLTTAATGLADSVGTVAPGLEFFGTPGATTGLLACGSAPRLTELVGNEPICGRL